MKRKKTPLFVLISVMALAWVSVGFLSDQETISAGTVLPEYNIPRHIQYSFTVKNTTGRLIKDAEFWTYGPVKQTSTQVCENIKTSYPAEITVDTLGNQVLHCRFEDLPPYSTKIVTVEAALMLSDRANPLSMADTITYLGPEKYLESDDAQIVQKAKELTGNSPLKTAEKIFNWVSGHIQYAGYLSNERGALYALREKKGDCTEYMYLFAALCRASQIPVRCIGGYVCPSNMVLKPAAYHNWAEFYDQGTWHVADPQKKVFMKDHGAYIAMRIIDPASKNEMGDYHRFRFEGEGVRVKMNP